MIDDASRDTMTNIIGQKIVAVQKLPKRTLDAEGWEGRSGVMIVLENGVYIYPSNDHEGNAPGALFASSRRNRWYVVPTNAR